MRNYKSETKWAKEKYEHISCAIDKKLGIELKEQLKKSNISMAKWITENAKKFLKKS